MKSFLQRLFGPRPLRGFRFWALVAVVVYTVFGFFIAPLIVQDQIEKQLSAATNRAVTVENVKINPFALSLTIEGFAMADLDGEPLAALARGYVNFQSSSLFRWAWTFDEIDLQAPYFALRVNADRALSIADLTTADAPSDEPSPAEQIDGAALPALKIFATRISNGVIHIEDNSIPTPFVQDIEPINLTLTEFETTGEESSPYQIDAALPSGARFGWQGQFRTQPLQASGSMDIGDLSLTTGWRYIQDSVRFEIDEGTLGGRLDYLASVKPEGLELTLDKIGVNVDNLVLKAQARQSRDIAAGNISLVGGKLVLHERSFTADTLQVNQLAIATHRDQEGALDIVDLLKFAEESEARALASEQPWQWSLAELSITNSRSRLEDRTFEPTLVNETADLNLRLTDLNGQQGSQFGLELSALINGRGQLTTNGTVSILPLSVTTELDLQDLPIQPMQPAINRFLNADINEEAGLGIQGSLKAGDQLARPFSFQGQVSVSQLSIADRALGETVLGLTGAEARGLKLALAPFEAQIDQLALNGLSSTLAIAADGTTNLNELMVASATEDTPSTGSESSFQLDTLILTDSSLSVSDQRMEPTFSLGLTELSGQIKGLSSDNLARADVDLSAKLDQYAPISIAGQINPLADDVYSDIVFSLEGFGMSRLSPYSGRYAGRKIDKGKANIKMEYRLSKRELIGQNEMLFDQLELGENVQSEDDLGLPIGLAVALLKDAKGQLQMDVPVRGNLDDPEFHVGHLVMRAFVNLIGSIATSPFKLLGKIVAAGDQPLDHVYFAAGQSTLSENASDKIAKLSVALADRPQLQLEIRGAYAPDADALAMARQSLTTQIGVEAMDAPADHIDTIRAFAASQLPPETIAQLQSEATTLAETEDQEAVVDTSAFANALIETMIAQFSSGFGETELRALASARAESVRAAVLAADGEAFSADRIFMLDVQPAAVDVDGVRMDFGLTTQ